MYEAYAPLGSPENMGQKALVMEDPVIKEIAEKHGATPGQVEYDIAIATFLFVM